MSENDTQSPSNSTADNGSIVNNFNNAGGTITGSTINITNIVGLPDDGKRSLLTEAEISRQPFEPKTILIPAGEFMMGSEPAEGIPDYETPRHKVNLPTYRIGKHPVTNEQYKEYLVQTGARISSSIWDGKRALPDGLEDQPVAGVTWDEALAYCQWLKEKTKRTYQLPSEAQWEKACHEGSLEGKILEWTCTLWGIDPEMPDKKYAYPWKENDGRSTQDSRLGIRRVIRGSSMNEDKKWQRCNVRRGIDPNLPGIRGARHGFRVAMSIESRLSNKVEMLNDGTG